MGRKHLRPFATCAAVISLCAVPARGQTPWSQYQGNAAHTGFVAETVDDPLMRRWEKAFTFDQGFPAPVSALVVNNQGIFTSIGQGAETVGTDIYGKYALVSLERTTGQEQWRTPILSYTGTVSAPSLGANTVYVHNFGHSNSGGPIPEHYPRLVGVNADTGQVRFAMAHEGQWFSGSRPTVMGDQVVALGGSDGGVDSYDALTGAHQWFTQLPFQDDYIPAMDQQRVYIYYGAASAVPGPQIGTLYAIDRTTGTIDYTVQNPADAFTTFSDISSVALGGQNDAFVINRADFSFHNQVTSFSLQQHTVNWNRELDAVNALALASGEIAIPLSDSLKMIDEATGTDIWTWTPPDNAILNSNVLLTENLAFVASSDTLFGVDRASGQTAWSTFIGHDLGSFNLAYYNGTLYMSDAHRIITLAVAAPEPPGGLLLSIGILTLFTSMVFCGRHKS